MAPVARAAKASAGQPPRTQSTQRNARGLQPVRCAAAFAKAGAPKARGMGRPAAGPGAGHTSPGAWPRRGQDHPTTFSPITPDTISPMHSSRGHEALSPNSTMPSAAAPTAPIPVQIA